MTSSIKKSSPSFLGLKTPFHTVVAAAFFLSTPFLRADLNSDPTPKLKKKDVPTGRTQVTAVAEDVRAEVIRAGDVVVRLHGIASGGGRLEFRLIQKPLHGRILQSKPVGMDSLDVTYRHSGDTSSDQDTFIYAVRSLAGGPFSPGRALIAIQDRPGRLLIPEALTFPPTLVGQTATDSFVVVNEGGETLHGKITINDPWHLQGTANYNLNPGEKRKITVLFTPVSNGLSEGRLIFEGAKPAIISLQGEGLGTFLASPAKVKLLPTPAGTRSGMVALQNNSPEPITISLKSALNLPKSVTLQFGETKELPIEDSGIGLLASHITFQAGTYAMRVDVSADEAPYRADSAPAPIVAAATPVALVVTPPPAPIVLNQTPAPTPMVAEETPAPPAIAAAPLLYLSARLVPLSYSRIQLEWAAADPSVSYAIEQRYLLLDNEKKIKVQWVAVPTARIMVNTHQARAVIGDLDADTLFTFRVVQSGDASQLTSLPLNYRTPPNFFHRLTWRSWIYPTAALLLGLVLWKRWRERDSSY